MNIALYIILGLLTAGLAVLYLTLRLQVGFLRDLQGIFEKEGADKPSRAEVFIEAVSSAFAQKMMTQAKTTAMGLKSGEVRQAKAIDRALMQDQLNNANPLVGMLAQQFPQLSKLLQSNPQLVGMALQKLGGLNLGQGGNNKPNDFAERLGKYGT